MTEPLEATAGKQPEDWSHKAYPKVAHCSKCGEPCAAVHDIEMSACCFKPVEFKEIDL